MIRPSPLQNGDRIGILSTARKISREEVLPACAILESWGFRINFAPHLFEEHHQFAGTDAQRREDLQAFISDREIKAIFCARGGYGTVRIIDQINFDPLLEHPKWICGYSDVTVLHNKLSKLGLESLHCSMPINFKDNSQESLESIRMVLKGESLSYRIPVHDYNRQGIASGELTGGNLSMLYSQAGSSTALDTRNRILFIEDLDEYLYHIDRMMYNLKRNNYLENLAGVIVGSMNDMNDNKIGFGYTAEQIIRDHLKDYNYPVCFNFPAGHLSDNRALIMGRKLTLNVGNTVVVEFES